MAILNRRRDTHDAEELQGLDVAVWGGGTGGVAAAVQLALASGLCY